MPESLRLSVTGPLPVLEPVSEIVRLHVLRTPGSGRPYVLVHGLASNARLWYGVAAGLAAAGHETVAVDLRGHGLSDAPPTGYDTATAASDVAAVVDRLALTGDRAPVVVGQSWGGNVVLELAAVRPEAVHALALVDGGWIRLRVAFPEWLDCERTLAPPRLDGMRATDLEHHLRQAHPDWPDESIAATMANLDVQPDGTLRARLSRERHLAILRSMWESDPRELYPRVTVPVLLVPAYGRGGKAAEGKRALVAEATTLLRDARVVVYENADHDLHAQHPHRLAADLETLA